MQAKRCQLAATTLRHNSQNASEYAFPAIIMSALSSELYLKCLKLIEDANWIPTQEHSLAKLKSNLLLATQKRINARWLELHGSDLTPYLRESAEMFLRFRYFYEWESLDAQSALRLLDLPPVLEYIVLQECPNFERLNIRTSAIGFTGA